MRAVVGLGNPGKRYEKTRHNVGFLIIDFFLKELQIPFKAGKGDYYFAEIIRQGERIMLVKPATFMNRSGLAIYQLFKYHPVSAEELLIVYDDFNLPFGTFRFRPYGSDGGHNGIKSILYELKSDIFDRFRVGIGNEFFDAVNHVLSKFSKQELAELNNLLPITKDAICSWIDNGMDNTMNLFNRSYIDRNSN